MGKQVLWERPDKDLSHILGGKRLQWSAFKGGVGGAQHREKVAGPQKPGSQCGRKKEARRRQALQNKLGGFKNVRAAPRVRKGPGKVETGECILDLAAGNLTGFRKVVHGKARLQE